MPTRGWHGLSVVDDRLWLRWERRRRCRLRLDPEALVVVEGATETRLEWTQHSSHAGARPTWQCWGYPGSRSNRAGIDVRVHHPNANPFQFPEEDMWTVPAGWLMMAYAFKELPALAHYLAQTPAARPGLKSGALLAELVAELAERPTFGDRPHDHHLMGDRLDVDIAIDATLDAEGLRRFGGRTVRGERVPSPADIVESTRRRLPHWVEPRVSDEQIAARAARLLDSRPWPFDVLLRNG